MSDIWFIADLHLRHTRIVTGFDDSGSGPRGHFGSIEAHDAAIMDNWLRVVKPQDKIYVLGDVALSKPGLDLVAALPGKKRLIMGNHDQDTPARYAAIFQKVCGAKTLDGMILTHIPVHATQLTRRSMRVNLHGHLHDEVIESHYASAYRGNGVTVDPRYQCVSCEQVNYTPIHYDEVIANFGDALKDTE